MFQKDFLKTPAYIDLSDLVSTKVKSLRVLIYNSSLLLQFLSITSCCDVFLFSFEKNCFNFVHWFLKFFFQTFSVR